MGLLLYLLVFVALLAVLWNVSQTAKYYIKFIVFGIVSIISACGPIPIMLLRPRDSRNALIPAAGLRACCRFLGITYSVEGIENIVQGSGCVVLINHQSMLDLIVLACLWPVMPNCTVISKKEIFYLQPFGLASWLWGTMFIDRSKVKDAQTTVNKTGATINSRKARVLMFPEGTRNDKKNFCHSKRCISFGSCIKMSCSTCGSIKVHLLGKNRFDDGHIRIRILPAISTEGYTTEDMPKLIDEAYKVMSENVNLLSSNNHEKFKSS